jgi:predicted outer membrane repeat protein
MLTVLRNNTAATVGGAVAVSGPTRLHASDCSFESNTAFNNATQDDRGRGGVLYANGSAAVAVINSSMTKNHAGCGGAVFAAGNSSVNLSNAVKGVFNKAVFDGGAAYLANFAIVSLSHGVLFRGNVAGQSYQGGGIAAYDNSDLKLGPEVQVTNNTARRGGGIATDDSSKLTFIQTGGVAKVFVTGNVADSKGGGFYLSSETLPWQDARTAASLNTAPYGAIVYVPTKRLQIVNGTTQLDLVSRLDASGVQITVNASGSSGIDGYPYCTGRAGIA